MERCRLEDVVERLIAEGSVGAKVEKGNKSIMIAKCASWRGREKEKTGAERRAV